MKRKFIIVALTLACTLFSTNARAEVDPNFYIYLCFGQSNMEGQGTIEDCDLTPDARFQMMSTLDCGTRKQGEWYRAVPPLARCSTNLCPADYFGRTMVANLDEGKRVGVVMVAIGGVAIDLFDPDGWKANVAAMTETWQISAVNAYGGNPLGRLMECAKKAQQSGVIKGILLHQGETDAYNNTWLEKVKKVYQYMLSELNLKAEDVPLIAGEVGHADQKGRCASANNTIDRLPSVIPTAHVVSSAGCTLQSDNLHFDSQGYRKLGRRYAKEALGVLGIEADIDEDEVPQVDVNEPIDMTTRFTSLWNPAESMTTDNNGTIIFNAVQWGGLSCWLGDADWSPYEKIVFEFAEPTTMNTQILIMTATDKRIAGTAPAGANKIELNFANEDVTHVTQVALQAAAAGTLKISKIYLTRKSTAGISAPLHPTTNDPQTKEYSVSGVPITTPRYSGIIISNNRKILRK